jgi:hypothetical protein
MDNTYSVDTVDPKETLEKFNKLSDEQKNWILE